MRKDVAVVLCIWAKTVSCLRNVCDCDACKLIRKSKLIDLLRCTDVYVCKSWVMPSQWQFTASHRYVCVQKLSRAFAMTVWMSYISCSACTKTLLSFCVYKQRLCHVFAVYVIAMHVNWPDKAKNRSIYCIMQTCRCAKVESCLCNMCVCDVYKLQRMRKDVAVVLCIWAKTVLYLCSVCDCDACKSIW